MCLEDCGNKKTRREFLASAGAAAAFGGMILADCAAAQTTSGEKKTEQGFVVFNNGGDAIDGYLARPKKEGKFPAVLILHGNAALPEDVCRTASEMAEIGFVGLAVSSTSREPDASRITREFVSSERYIKRYVADAQAGIEHLKSQPFFDSDGGCGVLGYCGGGYTGARLALADRAVKALVALYAAPFFLPSSNSQTDPRPHLFDFVTGIKAPMQFHYGTNDHLISRRNVARFVEKLKSDKIKAEAFSYENADHGFANFVNPNYDAGYAKLAKKRWAKFLQKHL